MAEFFKPDLETQISFSYRNNRMSYALDQYVYTNYSMLARNMV